MRLYASILDDDQVVAKLDKRAKCNKATGIVDRLEHNEFYWTEDDEDIKWLEQQEAVYKPKDYYELKRIVYFITQSTLSLNWIDTSEIENMSGLFQNKRVANDISKWDTSKVVHMNDMFKGATICTDITNWNTKSVQSAVGMFDRAELELPDVDVLDLNKWNVGEVRNMSSMFNYARFKVDISQWNTEHVTDMSKMFYSSAVDCDLSKWNIDSVRNMNSMFAYSNFNHDISNWKLDPNCSSMWMFLGSSTKKIYKPIRFKNSVK